MRRLLLLSVCGVLGLWNATAQDVILKRDADEIKVKVTEITDTEVKYKKFSDQQGVTYSMPKAEVFSITYENGEKDRFTTQTARKEGDYPYPRVTQIYHVGDRFEEGDICGLVVRTTDGGRHGLILSFEEGKGMWGGVWGEEISESFHGFDCHCTNTEDGWKNMQAIADMIAHTKLTWDNFPAFKWCRDLGDGWYLPANKELDEVFAYSDKLRKFSTAKIKDFKEHRETVRKLNDLLEQMGENKLHSTMSVYSCWSSTEYRNEEFEDPYQWKAGNRWIRAFHKF